MSLTTCKEDYYIPIIYFIVQAIISWDNYLHDVNLE